MKDLSNPTTVIPVGPKAWSSRALAKVLALSCVGVLTVAPVASAQSLSTVLSGMGPLVTSTAEPKILTAEKANQEYPLVELGAMDSKVGESKEDFLLRVGTVLHGFTGQTGHEACSGIMESQQPNASGVPVYRVRLITNRSQISCLRVLFNEQGFKYTGETIHSHPYSVSPWNGKYTDHQIRANRVDQRLRGLTCGQNMKIADETFSDGDIANGGGYLVARGKLLYLNAETHDHAAHAAQERMEHTAAALNDVVEIGNIDTSAPLPQLNVGAPNATNQHSFHAAQAVWLDRNSELLPTTLCRVPVSGPTLRVEQNKKK